MAEHIESCHELPCRVMTVLKQEMLGAYTQHAHEAVSNISNSSSIMRHSVTRQVDEMSPATARSVDKILRNPA